MLLVLKLRPSYLLGARVTYLLVTVSNNFISHLNEHFISNFASVFLVMSNSNLKSALHTKGELWTVQNFAEFAHFSS